uniref:Uncharacterized protein n=1 Tax=Oryza punctata TaxID=4537 RepID=A0A0E0JEY1_ORYPU
MKWVCRKLNEMDQNGRIYMRGRYVPPWPFLRIRGPAFSGTLSKTLLHASRTSLNPVARVANCSLSLISLVRRSRLLNDLPRCFTHSAGKPPGESQTEKCDWSPLAATSARIVDDILPAKIRVPETAAWSNEGLQQGWQWQRTMKQKNLTMNTKARRVAPTHLLADRAREGGEGCLRAPFSPAAAREARRGEASLRLAAARSETAREVEPCSNQRGGATEERERRRGDVASRPSDANATHAASRDRELRDLGFGEKAPTQHFLRERSRSSTIQQREDDKKNLVLDASTNHL